jgi:hypothetical protein
MSSRGYTATGRDDEPATLRIEVAQDVDGEFRTRVLVDGRYIPAEVVSDGAGPDLDTLLDGLRPATPAGTARLTATLCPDEGCHGALDVRVRRDGDMVVWDGWRAEGPHATGPLPGPVVFDGATYDAELARAGADRDWEPPEDAVARLVRARLEAEPGILGAWDCRLDMVLGSRTGVRLAVVPPPGDIDRSLRPHLLVLPLTAEAPAVQADRAVDALRRGDPLGDPPPPGWAAGRR